jgi:hypothetical protein
MRNTICDVSDNTKEQISKTLSLQKPEKEESL